MTPWLTTELAWPLLSVPSLPFLSPCSFALVFSLSFPSPLPLSPLSPYPSPHPLFFLPHPSCSSSCSSSPYSSSLPPPSTRCNLSLYPCSLLAQTCLQLCQAPGSPDAAFVPRDTPCGCSLIVPCICSCHLGTWELGGGGHPCHLWIGQEGLDGQTWGCVLGGGNHACLRPQDPGLLPLALPSPSSGWELLWAWRMVYLLLFLLLFLLPITQCWAPCRPGQA